MKKLIETTVLLTIISLVPLSMSIMGKDTPQFKRGLVSHLTR